MKVLVEKVTTRKLLILLIAIIFVASATNYIFTSIAYDLEDLTVELYSKSTPIKQGDRTVFQVLVYDSTNSPIEDVSVEIEFSSSSLKTEVMKHKLVHVENGLYEVDMQFFHQGNWKATVLISKGYGRITEPFELFVEK